MVISSTPAPTSAGKDRTWFITGASTGFGRVLAEEVLKAGGKVVATARNQDKVADLEAKYPERAKALALDVTDAGQVESAARHIVQQRLKQSGMRWSDPGAQAILNRMLLNLQGLFLPADLKSAAWVLQLRLTIPGLGVPDRLGLARALGSLGRFGAAAAELEKVADGLPEAEATPLRGEARSLRARAN